MDTNGNLGQLLFETAPHAICVLKMGRIVAANRQAAALFGALRAEIIGQHLADFSAVQQPDDLSDAHLLQLRLAVALSGQVEQFEWVCQPASGPTRFVQVALSRVSTAEAGLVQAIITDISGYKHAETALSDSERRLVDLVSFLPDATFAINTSGQLIAWNRAMEQLSGMLAADVLGQGDYIYAMPFYGERRPILANLALEADEDIAKNYPFIERDGDSLVTEVATPFLTREGNAVVWAKASRLFNTEGEVIGAIESVRDITDRKLIEEKIKASESQIRLILETTLDAVIVMNDQGVITEWNTQAENIFGHARADVVGKTVTDTIMPHRFRDMHRNGMAHFMATGEGPVLGQRIEIFALRHTGEEFPIELSISPYQQGDRWMFSAFARDISQRKQLQQQIQNALARRERQVQLSARVAQDTLLASDLTDLYRRIVTQIKEQFGYYHVQIFEHHPAQKNLSLAAGYGDVGEQMVALGYGVAVGQDLVGMAAAFGSTLIHSETRFLSRWRPHSLLPEATDEIAVPIRLGQQSAAAQAAALESFAKQGFDGVIVCVTDPQVIGPAVKQATDSGMHILTQSHDMGDDFQTLYVGAREFETGYQLGMQAGEWAKNHLAAGQPLNVGVLNHNSLPPVAEREAGILAGLEAAFGRDFTVVANETAPNPVLSEPLVRQWMQQFPAINMILAINDGGALGAYQAVKAAGKNHADSFFIGGVDGIDAALEAIAEGGAFQATVDKSAWVEGVPALHTLIEAILGEPHPDKLYVETRPVNLANLAEVRASRQPSPPPEHINQYDFTELKIGLSVMNLDNPFFGAFAQVVAAEAQNLGAQLVIHDPKTVLGVLDIHTDHAHQLGQEDRLVLEGLAGQLALAIENTRLLEDANVFRQFAEAAGQGLGMASLDGRVLYMNPALLKILGRESLDDVLDDNMLAYYPPERHAYITETVLPHMHEQGQWVGDSVLVNTRGQHIAVIENIFLIRDEAGAPLYMANAVTDITARKQVETELEARVQQLNSLQRLMTREGWQSYQTGQPDQPVGYHFAESVIRPILSESRPGDAPDQADSVAVPLAVHGEQIGHIGLLAGSEALSPDDQRFLNSVAEQVAEALERARLLEQTHKRAVELETVAEVGTVASTVLAANQLLQTVVDLTKERFDLYHAHIYLLDEQAQTLNLAAGAGEVGRQMVAQGWHISLQDPESVVARVARTQSGVIVNNVAQAPHHLPNPLLPNARSEMAVPLLVGGLLLGVLDVQDDVINSFTQDDIRIQTTLASQVAVALQNAGQYQKIQEQAQRLSLLNELSTAISQATDTAAVFQIVGESISRIVGGDSIGLGLLMDDDQQLEMLTLNDGKTAVVDGEPRPAAGTAVERVINQREVIIIRGDEGHQFKDIERMRRSGLAAVMVAPLLSGDAGRGAILVGSSRPDTFGQSEATLLQQIGAMLAANLENRRLFEQTQISLGETAALYRITRGLTQATDEKTMFETTLTEYLKQLNLTQGGVLIFDDALMAGTLAALMIDGELVEPGMRIPVQNNPACQKVIDTHQAVAIADALHDPLLAPVRDIADELGYMSMLLVPIVVHGSVIGALGADSVSERHFYSAREIAFMQAVADQLGVAIQRQRLAAETEQALEEVERTQRRYTVQAWENYRTRLGKMEYQTTRPNAQLSPDWQPDGLEQAIENKQAVLFTASPAEHSGALNAPEANLIVPLKVRNEVVGVLGLQETDAVRPWSQEEISLVEAIAEQIALAAENLRLVDETQQRAAREQRVNEIGQKISSAQSLEEALQIAVKEVGISLQSPQTAVELKLE